MTRQVKIAVEAIAGRALLVENAGAVHYNVEVTNVRISGHLVLALACAPLLMGGACEKKPDKPTDTDVISALEHAGSHGSGAVDGPIDTTPLPGIDASKLGDDKQKLFFKLVGSLNSPCGKAHSLRKSFTSDTSCKRAPFAVRYVLAMIEDEGPEDLVRTMFTAKYEKKDPPVKFDLSKEPHVGSDDASIRLVEFYDYGCPHCEEFVSAMEKVLAEEKGKVIAYFMHFNLGHFPNSKEAAQAALAAAAQGKFMQMHDLLFKNRSAHDAASLDGYAQQLGLDMTKFKADYAAAEPHVDAQKAQGDAAGVDSTPTLYFNDRKYEGLMSPKYIEMWIDEEMAVNR